MGHLNKPNIRLPIFSPLPQSTPKVLNNDIKSVAIKAQLNTRKMSGINMLNS